MPGLEQYEAYLEWCDITNMVSVKYAPLRDTVAPYLTEVGESALVQFHAVGRLFLFLYNETKTSTLEKRALDTLGSISDNTRMEFKNFVYSAKTLRSINAFAKNPNRHTIEPMLEKLKVFADGVEFNFYRLVDSQYLLGEQSADEKLEITRGHIMRTFSWYIACYEQLRTIGIWLKRIEPHKL